MAFWDFLRGGDKGAQQETLSQQQSLSTPPRSELQPPDLSPDDARDFEMILTRLRDHPGDFYIFNKEIDMATARERVHVNLLSRDGSMYISPETDSAYLQAGFIDPGIKAITKQFTTRDKGISALCKNIANDCKNFLHRQKIEARRVKQPIALTEPIKADPSASDLHTKILAMAEEEPPVTDALSAMQFGDGLSRVVNEASTRFLEATIGAHNKFGQTNAALRELVEEIRQTAQTMNGNGGGETVSFENMQDQIKALRTKITGAMTACLENFRDGTASVELFTACNSALTALREKGAEQLKTAQQDGNDWGNDLEQSLQTLAIAAISATRYQGTAKLAADAERASVHALKQLGNTLPVLESQIVAALAIERQAMTAEMGQGASALVGNGNTVLEQTRQAIRQTFLDAAEGIETAMEELALAQKTAIQTALPSGTADTPQPQIPG